MRKASKALALSALSGLAALCASLPAASATNAAAIVRGAGESKVDGAKEWRETVTGDVLTAGLTVRASNDQPLEMILPDAVTITLEAGATAYYTKPFSPTALLKEIESIPAREVARSQPK